MMTQGLVLLSIQDALVGEVFPSLRAVDVSWDESRVDVLFFVSSKLNDDEEEAISSIEAEMSAHLNSKVEVHSEVNVVSSDSPLPQRRGKVCVFARKQ